MLVLPDNHSFDLPSKNYNNRSQGTDIKTHLVNQYSGTEDPCQFNQLKKSLLLSKKSKIP